MYVDAKQMVEQENNYTMTKERKAEFYDHGTQSTDTNAYHYPSMYKVLYSVRNVSYYNAGYMNLCDASI